MKTILIADDLPAELDLFEVILQRADCRLVRAEDGISALRLAREEKPDLIYLDVEMPGMGGGEVCRMLKADPERRRVPVVLVSSHGRRDTAMKCGADQFLGKPVDEPTLLATLEAFLRLQARGERRLSVDWPLTFWREGSSHSGRILDVSRSGFFGECRRPQTVGSRLAVAFPLPDSGAGEDRTFVGEAIVVRWENAPRSGMGCRFFRMTSAGTAGLDRVFDESGAAG
ncbi:MAG TPA: response regulator [Thermoanaerobaculia bacterium]|nr:response regulator [Thermoanaerobaculia bacterium]